MLPKSFLVPVSTLLAFNYVSLAQQVVLEQTSPSLTFQLRHLHAMLPDGSQSLFADVNPVRVSSNEQFLVPGVIQTSPTIVHKPRFVDSERGRRVLDVERWEMELVLAPDVSDRTTMHELSKMCNNAYFEPDEEKWYNLGGRWDVCHLSHCNKP